MILLHNIVTERRTYINTFLRISMRLLMYWIVVIQFKSLHLVTMLLHDEIYIIDCLGNIGVSACDYGTRIYVKSFLKQACAAN